MTTEEKAVEAVREYEWWASEVARLTNAIKGEVCPEESPPEAETHWFGVGSCFSDAAQEEIVTAPADIYGPEERRKLSLEEIEAEVKDCPSCTRLCELIRARRHARKRYGVAKRGVRHVGKLILEATRREK